MIEQETPPCPLGLDSATLSALRDESLPSDELRRLREHAATCPACQERLAEFERIQRALRRQRELEPGDRIWRGIQHRAMSAIGNRHPRPPARLSTSAMRNLAAVASLALVVGLLAIMLANASGNRPGTTAGPTASATPSATSNANGMVPGPQLVWHALPPAPPGLSPVLSPSNGDDGYECQEPEPGATGAAIYVTRDGGQTWTHAGDLPVGANPQPSDTAGKPDTLYCQLRVDAINPATAVAETLWTTMGASPPSSYYTSFATSDFGAHWQKVPASGALVMQLASLQGRIYSYREGDDASFSKTLWVSADNMTTWQAAGEALPTPLQAFWLNPSTGALLVLAYGPNGSGTQFYWSKGPGATWRTFPNSPLGQGTQWVVQAPRGETVWQLCAYLSPSGGSNDQSQPNSLSCSTDGGLTWVSRAALNVQQNSPKGFTFTAPAFAFAIADDGAILATVIGPPPEHIYRLPVGASAWQDMGPLPTSFYNGPQYFPAPGSGLLWFSGQSSAYTATYPGT